ncbi:molybdopterin-dependent oxidoreductase [Sphaerisporangium rhizosphaerae]|uniref:Molybdopterin-dependent oxidoreductase n=1 Tax=Sphaerisporangium rhizosphaerae TaxID=2269375 RepID=A0ABW2P6L9_9ACTN
MNLNQTRPRGQAWAAALIGLVAGAVALGIGQLAAGLLDPKASPVIAVGDAAVDRTPAALKEWAIRTFGASDKFVLISGIVVVLALVAAGLGLLARRRAGYATAGLLAFGVVGAVAAVTRPDGAVLDVLPSVVGAAAGAWALRILVRRAWPDAEPGYGFPRYDDPAALSGAATIRERDPQDLHGGEDLRDSSAAGSPAGASSATGSAWAGGSATGSGGAGRSATGSSATGAGGGGAPAASGAAMEPREPQDAEARPAGRPAVMRGTAEEPEFDRRALLGGVAAGVVVAGAGGLIGRALGGRLDVSTERAKLALPRAATPAKPLPSGVDFRLDGLSPFTTPNRDFYRVDTALVVPQVDPKTWTLKIHGMVDRPVEITFADLLKRPLMEADVTLTCVSNDVGDNYVGNARWLGARLADVLRDAGIRSGADMLLSTSSDGWTCGTPVDIVMDGRDALLAVAMNGEALPVSHGFPVRQVVPGLYGYVSATKWVTDIKVTRFDQDEAYWTPRGWAPKGPIKTESRIDLPRGGSTIPAGRTAIAGVAWAQHRGVDAVEVRVDKGTWRQARLAAVPGPDTWRQWVVDDWDATPGKHTIEVRATDATGQTQTADYAPPAPDGATGWHSILVVVK